jgi:hypothetical protein
MEMRENHSLLDHKFIGTLAILYYHTWQNVSSKTNYQKLKKLIRCSSCFF